MGAEEKFSIDTFFYQIQKNKIFLDKVGCYLFLIPYGVISAIFGINDGCKIEKIKNCFDCFVSGTIYDSIIHHLLPAISITLILFKCVLNLLFSPAYNHHLLQTHLTFSNPLFIFNEAMIGEKIQVSFKTIVELISSAIDSCCTLTSVM